MVEPAWTGKGVGAHLRGGMVGNSAHCPLTWMDIRQPCLAFWVSFALHGLGNSAIGVLWASSLF